MEHANSIDTARRRPRVIWLWIFEGAAFAKECLCMSRVARRLEERGFYPDSHVRCHLFASVRKAPVRMRAEFPSESFTLKASL